MSTTRSRTIWTFIITSLALVMVTLDNLVVTTALPVLRDKLHASLESLEWTVNAYTLSFAVLLLTGAALGDRFGRRLLFVIGLGIFTAASAAAALAPNVDALNIARAVQGLGGAIVAPLTLTLLSAAVPPEKRGVALGAWGGIGGLAVALGPLVGGAVVEGIEPTVLIQTDWAVKATSLGVEPGIQVISFLICRYSKGVAAVLIRPSRS